MRGVSIIFTALAVTLGIAGCHRRTSASEQELFNAMSAEEVLEQMRNDTSYINTLDSLAQLRIGPGARHIDAVKHLVGYEGRTFLFGCDWGTVLEIPRGWSVADDMGQAELSFHGTSAFSPDSLVRISYYGGFQVMENVEEEKEGFITWAEDEGISIQSVRVDTMEFEGTTSPVIHISGCNGDGINVAIKSVFADHRHVKHTVCLQWPDEAQSQAEDVLSYMQRFPFGPLGQAPEGWATEE